MSRWGHDKAKCGKCGKVFTGLNSRRSLQNHQNRKHGGKGKHLYYDTEQGKWEDELQEEVKASK